MLSVPEVTQHMTLTTTPPREPRSDYELDDVESRILIRTWEAANKRDEEKRKKGEKAR